MPRVAHFELPIDDPERAVKSYEQAFGWQINNWGGPVDYWLATTGLDEQHRYGGHSLRNHTV